MKKLPVFCIFLLLMLACNSGSEDKIIPKKRLIPLLVDMHIADATALNYSVNEHFGKLDSSILYYTVLNSHGYTKDDMVNTLKHYSSRTEDLTKIYDDVFAILSKQSESSKKLYSASSLSMTHRIWRAQTSRVIIKGDSMDYPPAYDFPVDTIGTFSLNFEVRINTQDQSINPRSLAYFYNPQNDVPEERVYFEEVNIGKSNHLREHILFVEQLDTSLTRVKIIIPIQDNKDSIFTKSFELHNMRLSLMGEEDLN